MRGSFGNAVFGRILADIFAFYDLQLFKDVTTHLARDASGWYCERRLELVAGAR